MHATVYINFGKKQHPNNEKEGHGHDGISAGPGDVGYEGKNERAKYGREFSADGIETEKFSISAFWDKGGIKRTADSLTPPQYQGHNKTQHPELPIMGDKPGPDHHTNKTD